MMLATASGGESLSQVILCIDGRACRPLFVVVRRHSGDHDRVAIANCRANLGCTSNVFIFSGGRCPRTRIVSLQ